MRTQVLAAMPRRVPVALEVGKSDPLLSYVRSDRLQLRGHGWTDGESFFYREFIGGHQYRPPSSPTSGSTFAVSRDALSVGVASRP
jgi:hypothetical protein